MERDDSSDNMNGSGSLTDELNVSGFTDELNVSGFTLAVSSLASRLPAIVDIRDGPLSLVKWYWTDSEGLEHEEVGVYLICDGGYHHWKILIAPFKDQLKGTDMHALSKHIESLRKDVECTFVILKKRFMLPWTTATSMPTLRDGTI
jgi:hypothetical protein